MLDIAVAYNRFKFLGEEFLTWLWYAIEKKPQDLTNQNKEPIILEIGNRIALENRQQDTVESITIKGDDAGMEEGILALRKGAMVTELNLIYRSAELQWHFTVKGESLNISNLKTPQQRLIEHKDDIEAAVLEKVYLTGVVIDNLNAVFATFLKQRLSEQWKHKMVPAMRKWIANEGQ